MPEFDVQIKWEPREDQPNERYMVANSEDRPKLEVVPPPDFSGIPGYWTPEHLFLASATSCYTMTYLKISKNSRLNVKSIAVKTTGILEEREDGQNWMKELILEPAITVLKESEVKKATRIAHMAEKACIIGNSIKAEMEINPSVNTA